jgi:hypothetical protein
MLSVRLETFTRQIKSFVLEFSRAHVCTKKVHQGLKYSMSLDLHLYLRIYFLSLLDPQLLIYF